jgi:hypothetical protein
VKHLQSFHGLLPAGERVSLGWLRWNLFRASIASLPGSTEPLDKDKKLVWDYDICIYGVFLQKISVKAHVHSINAPSTVRAAHLDMFMFSLWLYIGSCI